MRGSDFKEISTDSEIYKYFFSVLKRIIFFITAIIANTGPIGMRMNRHFKELRFSKSNVSESWRSVKVLKSRRLIYC